MPEFAVLDLYNLANPRSIGCAVVSSQELARLSVPDDRGGDRAIGTPAGGYCTGKVDSV
ncbi:MAG: hypothetical protein SWY16_07115 [Cyanobacteriota bacterium]|nr:hypothetical protein [Cyanobacteriota bacterium]